MTIRDAVRSPIQDSFKNERLAGGGGGVVGPSLPQLAHLAARWSADSLTPQSDNTAITANWVDAVNGYVLTPSATQPRYRTNAIGSKPAVQLLGTGWFSGLIPALKTVIDSKTYSVYIVHDRIQVRSNGTVFGNSNGGNSFMFHATGALVGRFNAPTLELRGPYTDIVSLITQGYTSANRKVYTSQSGTGLERQYLNGLCITSNTSVGPATTSVSGAFAIGARDDVGGLPSQCYVYDVLVWDKDLTEVEMAQVEIWARAKYGLQPAWNGLARMYHFDGDSLTVGVGTPTVASSYPYLNAQSLGLGYGQWAMHAVGGITTQDMSGNAGSTKLSDWIGLLALTSIPARVMAWEWYNEKNTGRTAQAYSDMVTYCSTIKGNANVKLCLGSSTGYTGDGADPYASVRGAYNALLDTNNASMANAYVAIHNSTDIGDANSYATNSAANWAGDGVHLNATGRTFLAALMLAGATAINN